MDALMAFAVANAGMTETVRRTETISSQSWTVVCLSKSGRHWWFRWRTSSVFGMPSSSNAGAAWATLTDRPSQDAEVAPIIEPYTSYHFFTEGTCVHAAVEMSNGAYVHMSFGDITKFGSWTGGHYFANTRTLYNDPSHYNIPDSNNHHFMFMGFDKGVVSNTQRSIMYVPYNSKNYAYIQDSVVSGFNTVIAAGFSGGIYNRFIANSPNAFNDRTVGVPIMMYLLENASGGSNLHMPLGYVPNIRFINIRDLAPKDLVNTDWMVFPLQSKNTGLQNSYANSGNYGWAIRK